MDGGKTRTKAEIRTEQVQIDEICATSKPAGPDPALPLIRERMSTVRRKILVLSGKGGVGKSTFCAQLAWAFATDEDTQVSHNSVYRTYDASYSSTLVSLIDWNHGR